MNSVGKAIARAVFIRTDTPHYAEEVEEAKDLDELLRACTSIQTNRVLDRILIVSGNQPQKQELVLDFVSASEIP